MLERHKGTSMKAVARCNVPAYLQNSSFFQSLDAENDGSIAVPENCFKSDTFISDSRDLDSFLATLRFWIIDRIPNELIELALDENCSYFVDVSATYQNELRFLKDLVLVRAASPEDRLKVAAQSGQLVVVEYLVEHKYCVDDEAASAASESGHLPCLQYLHSVGCHMKGDICSLTALQGHADCLQFCLQHTRLINKGIVVNNAVKGNNLECVRVAVEHGGAVGGHALQLAAKQGNLAIVQYIYSQGITWDLCDTNIAEAVAELGHLDCLKFALDNGCEASEKILDFAGTLPCLEYLYNRGHRWTECSSAEAAGKGIHMLKFAHEHGCVLTDMTYYFCFAHADCMECITYACEHGCPWSTNSLQRAVECDCLEAVQYMHTHGCEVSPEAVDNAVKNQRDTILAFFMEHNVPFSHEACVSAARLGRIDLLRYACEHACALDESVLTACLESCPFTQDYLQCMRCVHESGCQLTEDIFTRAVFHAREDNVKGLKYLLQNHCPTGDVVSHARTVHGLRLLHSAGYVFTATDMAMAARRGITHVQYLRSVNCPWDATACMESVQHGRDTETLRFLHDHGCPWDDRTLIKAVRVHHYIALLYAHYSGCPLTRAVVQAASHCPDIEITHFIETHASVTVNCSCVVQ